MCTSAKAIAVVAVLALAASCLVARRPLSRPTYRYSVPERTADGWETADLTTANLDARSIGELFQGIQEGVYPEIHSVLIVRNSKLVVEEYFAGTHPVLYETLKEGADWNGRHQSFDRDTLHTVQSVNKSIVSILVGIAIDRGLIRDADEKISTFFPQTVSPQDIRLRHFLSMTAGLEWDEWLPLTDPRNDCIRMNESDDPIAMLLARPSVVAPGSTFNYNSAVSVALGGIVRKASGRPVDQFAVEHLFEPMGITNVAWKGRFPNGVIHTGGGLYLRPRDMAKIGCMMLNNGRWKDQQIVSESWVRESLKQQAPDRAYGYQWWLHTFTVGERKLSACYAGGYGGQFIFLVPELDMVVVSTGWNPDKGGKVVELIQRFILPAAH